MHAIVRHKVADFPAWKLLFDAHREARQAAGLKNLFVWKNADDPSEVIMLFEVDDLSKANQFASSPEVQQAMEAAGVLGPPEFVFLEG